MKKYKNGRERVATLMSNWTQRKLAMLAGNANCSRPEMLEKIINAEWDRIFSNEFISLEDVAD